MLEVSSSEAHIGGGSKLSCTITGEGPCGIANLCGDHKMNATFAHKIVVNTRTREQQHKLDNIFVIKFRRDRVRGCTSHQILSQCTWAIFFKLQEKNVQISDAKTAPRCVTLLHIYWRDSNRIKCIKLDTFQTDSHIGRDKIIFEI